MIEESRFSDWWDRQKGQIKSGFEKLVNEIMETKDASRIMLKLMSGENTSKEEKVFLKEQILDVMKTIGLGGVVALPGGMFVVYLLVKIAKSMNMDIRPSSFKEEDEGKPIVITFDFDNTLRLVTGEPRPQYIKKFKEHSDRGHEVHIVTSRAMSKKSLQEIKLFSMENGLKPVSILHTEGSDKAPTLENLGSVLHYDDDEYEIEANDKLGIKSINVSDAETEAATVKWMQDEYGIGLPDEDEI